MQLFEEICLSYCTLERYIYYIEAGLADMLAELDKYYKIATITVSKNINIEFKYHHAIITVACKKPLCLFNENFDYVKKLCVYYVTPITFHGGNVKYYFGYARYIKFLESVEYVHSAITQTGAGIIFTNYESYYYKEDFDNRIVIEHYRCEYPIQPYVKVEQVVCTKPEIVKAKKYQCSAEQLARVLEFNPSAVHLENINSDTMNLLAASRIKYLRLPYSTPEMLEQLAKNPHLRTLTFDQEPDDYSPLLNSSLLSVMHFGDYPELDEYLDQNVRSQYQSANVKSARNV